MNKLLLSACVVLLLMVGSLYAEWGRTADDPIGLYANRPQLAADCTGGVWITTKLLGQWRYTGITLLDRYGNFEFENWIDVLPGFSNISSYHVTSTNCDVIVAVVAVEERNDIQTARIRVQKINRQGELIWGNEGIIPFNWDPFEDAQNLVGAVTDGEGGAILVCDRLHLLYGNQYDHYPHVQRITAEGELLWDSTGVDLGWDEYYWHDVWVNSAVLSDNNGGILISSLQHDAGYLGIHKININGNKIWGEYGNQEVEAEEYFGLYSRSIAPDGIGGCLLATEYRKDGVDEKGINVYRINEEGGLAWERNIYSRSRDRSDPQFYTNINALTDGKFLVSWADHDTLVQCTGIDENGNPLWEDQEQIFLSTDGGMALQSVQSDSSVYLIWSERGTIRVQKVDVHGNLLWDENGLAAIQRGDIWLKATTDGNGGLIIGLHTGGMSSYLAMVNRNGDIGVVLPVSVKDDNVKPNSPPLSPQLYIYPNPGNSQFRIDFISAFPNELFNYYIYDLTGRSVKSGLMMGAHHIVDDLSLFSSGEYIIQIQSPRITMSKRFMLMK